MSLLRLALMLAALGYGARLAFQPDPADELRRADRLFAEGRYYHALAAYESLAQHTARFAPALARAGMVRVVRGEHSAAGQLLAEALGLGLSGDERNLALLYQGQASAALGRRAEAVQFWSMIDERSPLAAFGRILDAESLLAAADYAGAEAAYRSALGWPLPSNWRAAVATRLATLRASSDPVAALAELSPPETASAVRVLPAPAPLIDPLLPTPAPPASALAAALRAPAPERAQLLGQLYLRAGLYGLAEAQFASIAAADPAATTAAIYAAYTRWLAGDRAGGMRRLATLVTAHPSNSRLRTLIALTYLASGDMGNARAQLEALRALAPRAPDTHLAWGQWHIAQHDYLAASEAYRQALASAPPTERTVYALALARFHVDTLVDSCESVGAAAAEATRLAPDEATAWVLLAAGSLACGDAPGARAAAERALQQNPGSAEASYYLGRALALLGDRVAARLALITAADLAPASAWRERAEVHLRLLGS